MKTVAVLFARAYSVYKTLPDLDVYDELRDSRNYTGDSPVIAHPHVLKTPPKLSRSSLCAAPRSPSAYSNHVSF